MESENNEDLEIYGLFLAEVNATTHAYLETISSRLISEGLSDAQAIQLALEDLAYLGRYEEQIAEVYLAQALDLHGGNSKNLAKISGHVNSAKAGSLAIETAISQGADFQMLASNVPVSVKAAHYVGIYGGWAVSAFAVLQQLSEDDTTGAVAEGLGAVAGFLVGASAAYGLALSTGVTVAALAVPLAIGAAGIGAIFGWEITNYLGGDEEGRSYIDSLIEFLEDQFFGVGSEVSLPILYELNNGEALFPGHLLHSYLISQIDPQFGQEQILQLVDSSSQVRYQGVEALLQNLEALFAVDTAAQSVASPEDYLQRIIGLSDKITSEGHSGRMLLVSDIDNLADLSLTEGPQGAAARYSLEQLTPFVYVSDHAEFYLQSGNAGMIDTSVYTPMYAEDRARLVQAIVSANIDNTPHPQAPDREAPTFYSDYKTGAAIVTGQLLLPNGVEAIDINDIDWVTFGDDGNNANLSGGPGNDHLYGKGGEDVLAGAAGNDHLEGGAGIDTYLFDNNGSPTGFDIIRDSQGNNIIKINGHILSTLQKSNSDGGSYFSKNASGDVIATVITNGASQLLIRIEGEGDNSILIEDFGFDLADNRFGLIFEDAVPLTPISPAVAGTWVVAQAVGESAITLTNGESGVKYPIDNFQRYGYDSRDPVFNTISLSFDVDNFSSYAETGPNQWGSNIAYAISGGNLADVLTGGGGAELLKGYAGADILRGENSRDYLMGGAGSDYLYGGSGSDVIWGTHNGFVNLEQTPNPDPLDARVREITGDSDYIEGNAGEDWLIGGNFNDIVRGGTGSDQIFGGAGNDVLQGGDHEDWIYGDSRMEATFVNDYVAGTYVASFTPVFIDTIADQYSYDDVIEGGGGNDYLFGETGNDILHGGPGEDQLVGDSTTFDVNGDLVPKLPPGNDILYGGADNDNLWGYGGDDKLFGGDDDDHLHGDAGDIPIQDHGADYLHGGPGNDHIWGHGGNDQLNGNEGDDRLVGGAGDDIYSVWSGEGSDVIDNTDLGNGLDILAFNGGVNPGSVHLSRHGDDLHIDTLAGVTTVQGQFRDYGTSNNKSYAIDVITFAGHTQSFTTREIATRVGLPVAEGEQLSVTAGMESVLSFSQLLANDSAGDVGVLTISTVSNATHGTVILDTLAETISFTPATGYSGDASFDYTVTDGVTDFVATTSLQVTSVAAPVGPAEPLPSQIHLNDIENGDGSRGFVLNGVGANDFSGYAVSSAGDVNGDGTDDLIIGAYQDDPNATNAGATFVVFGSSGDFTGGDGQYDLSQIENGDGSRGFVINGIGSYDQSGNSVSSAGDINGDGIDDLIIGATNFSSDGGSIVGASFVVFGSTQETTGGNGTLELSDVKNGDGSLGFVLEGRLGTRVGSSVASAGDFNNDGIDDLIIGSERFIDDYTVSTANPGAAYVVFGSATDFTGGVGRYELSSIENGDGSQGFIAKGINSGDGVGFTVSSAGDFNGDGIDDVIIGSNAVLASSASYAGSYVVFGSADDISGGDGVFELSDLENGDGSKGFAIMGTGGRPTVVSSAGDVNGDGLGDLILGGSPLGSVDAVGGSFVIFGSAADITGGSGKFDLNAVTAAGGALGYSITGPLYSSSGNAVSAAGDVNGDGLDDLIIGAYAENSGGASYLVYGSTADITGGDARFELADLRNGDGSLGYAINSPTTGPSQGNDSVGYSVAGAGDVNNDGVADLIIGAPQADPNGTNSGRSFVVFGVDSMANESPVDLPVPVVDEPPVSDPLPEEPPVEDPPADDPLPNGPPQEDAPQGVAPDVGDDILHGQLDQPNSFDFSQLLANDIDYDDDPLAITNISSDGLGTLTADFAAERFTYDPAPGESSIGFSYTLTDGTFISAGSASMQLAAGTMLTDTANDVDGSAEADVIFGLAGNDKIKGKGGDDLIVGGNGSDEIKGDKGNDVLVGGPGNDKLKGGDHNDQLFGGPGDDALKGEKGSDSYFVQLGGGRDTIDNNSKDFRKDHDVVQFEERIAPANLWFSRDGDNLLIDVIGTDDQITILKWYQKEKYQVDQFVTRAGVLNQSAVQMLVAAMAPFASPAGLGATVPAGVEAQIQSALAAAWQYTSDVPPDVVDDLVDVPTTDSEDDPVDPPSTSVPEDQGTLISVGADQLHGQQSIDNRFYFAELLSNDINYAGGTLAITDMTSDGSGSLTVDFFAKEFTYTPAAGELAVNFTYTLTDDSSSVTATASLRLYDGTTLTNGANDVDGSAGDDQISGLDGNDKIEGKDGDDIIIGGSGNDEVKGDKGNDIVIGGLGDDTVKGGDHSDQLFGGAGDDTLKGEKGDDTYFFDLGDGRDVVDNNSRDYAKDHDVIQFMDRVAPEDLWFSRQGDNLVIDIIGTNDQITVSKWYTEDKYQVDEIVTSEATLDGDSVESLVVAMAAHTPPIGLGAEWTPEMVAILQPEISLSWDLFA